MSRTEVAVDQRPTRKIRLTTMTYPQVIKMFGEAEARKLRASLHEVGLDTAPEPADLIELGLSVLARSDLGHYASITTLAGLLSSSEQFLRDHRIASDTIGEVKAQFDHFGYTLKAS